MPVTDISIAVFDFDGTLCDTLEAIAASADVALTEHHLPPADPQRLRASIGLSLPTLFDNVTSGTLTTAQINDLIRIYVSVFPEIAASKAAMFDGIADQLGALHQAGITLAVATSRSRDSAHELLDRFGVADMFTLIVGDDMVTRRKPHPEMLHTVLARIGCQPADAVMIGDAEYDVIMGQAAGLVTCAVTWGNGTRASLAARQPDHIVDHPEELAGVLIPDVAALPGV